MSKTTCGDFGGRNNRGRPCGRPAGMGTDREDGTCWQHPEVPRDQDLTARERRFADEWLKDMNAARAYRVIAEPGQSTTTGVATSQGHTMLHRPHVQRYISERLEAIFVDLEDQQRAVIARLFEIATGDLGTLMDGEWMRLRSLDDLPPGATRLVKRVKETKWGLDIQLHDPMGAIKLLGQYWDLFQETHKHVGADGGPIEYRDMSDDELKRRATVLQNRLAAVTASTNGKRNGRGG